MKPSIHFYEVILLAVVAAAVIGCWPGKQSYSSTCRIKVEPEGNDVSGPDGTGTANGEYDPFFMQENFFLPYQVKH